MKLVVSPLDPAEHLTLVIRADCLHLDPDCLRPALFDYDIKEGVVLAAQRHLRVGIETAKPQ